MNADITYKNFCNKSVSNIAYGCATLANIYKPIARRHLKCHSLFLISKLTVAQVKLVASVSDAK